MDRHHHLRHPKTRIEPVGEKKNYELSWPNIIRIDHVLKPRLTLDREAG